MQLPAQDLRSNIGTWAVANHDLPALAKRMTDILDTEKFDPGFEGQELTTTYFDTPNFYLRRARLKGQRYVTIRVRQYEPACVYAISAKTEAEKVRAPITNEQADMLLAGAYNATPWSSVLPGNILARIMEIAGDAQLQPVVAIKFKRYAVEDAVDRLTLDVHVKTDTGLCLPSNVLEHKSTDATAQSPFNFRPIKLSKFLWATNWS